MVHKLEVVTTFFLKRNQVFIFPYLSKIKSTILNLLREEPDLLSLCLDYFCTLLIFKLSKKNISTNDLVILRHRLV